MSCMSYTQVACQRKLIACRHENNLQVGRHMRAIFDNLRNIFLNLNHCQQVMQHDDIYLDVCCIPTYSLL